MKCSVVPRAKAEPSKQNTQTWRPRANVIETSEAFVLDVEMPGVSEKAAEVSVEKGELRITGAVDPFEQEGQATRVEFRTGSFERSFKLPDSVDSGKIEARMRHGVLHLTLPKREAVKPRTIKVKGE